MKTKQWTQLSAVVLALFSSILFIGCEEDNDIKMQDATIKVTLPETMSNSTAEGLSVKFTNKSSGSVKTEMTDATGQIMLSMEEGLYDIEVSGKKTYSQEINDSTTIHNEVNLIGFKENITLNSASAAIEIPLSISIPSKGWVIKEIYFSGSKTPSGGAYNKDQYIEIYNNTDTTMYADGISIGEAINLTSNNINVYNKEINQSTFIWTLYSIPGAGKEHPVQAGKSILMAPQPINHKAINSNSVDLSVADFQWYDQHATLSIQVPEIPDMNRYYSYSKTIWNLHSKGSRSIVVFKAGNMSNYFSQYVDSAHYSSGGQKQTSVRVPNEFILDVVETGSLEGIGSKSFAASLDLGYTGCSNSGSGKSVRRKIVEVKNGRVIYQDTNNSSTDFIQDATPQPKVFGGN